MRQNYNHKQRLYFPKRITELLSNVPDYPLTVIEAPMGYGKTTAVREYLIKSGVLFSWQNIYDNSKDSFWRGFCCNFENLDGNLALSLMQLGFPEDDVSMQTALALIAAISLPREMVIVMDDYHLANMPEITNFLTFLVVNEISNLHLVLISRFFDFLNIEELALKGYLYHITQENFAFTQAEIGRYYEQCGIHLATAQAQELHHLTEGWISALYLLMLNFEKSDAFAGSINIYRLLEQTVYDSLPDKIKTFLLSMAIFNSFTLQQADYVIPGFDTAKMMRELIRKNAFITFDASRKSYHLHSLFKSFLLEQLQLKPEYFRRQLYQRAAAWYAQSSDYLLAMRYAYLGKDFELLLDALVQDKGQSINGEHKALLITYFTECPLQYKIQYPYAVLIYAYRMFTFNELTLFEKACQVFLDIYTQLELPHSGDKNRLLGEYELIRSFTQYNDTEKMCEYYKRACDLLEEPSLILGNRSSWTYGSPSVLFLYYRKSGELLREVHTLHDSIPYYNKVTHDHGKGAGEIMAAERYYYMGDFQKAEIAMHSAYQAAAGSSGIMISTIYLNIKLAFMNGDLVQMLELFQKLRLDINEQKWYMFIHTIDICEAYIFSCLLMTERVQPWIKSGEFENTRLFYPAMAYLNIVYGKVLLTNGEYLKLIGRSEQFLEQASVYPNLLAQINIYIYLAAAYQCIGHEGDALSSLRQALDIAIPDHMYMPFVENCDYIKPLLEILQEEHVYPQHITLILALYKQFHSATQRMRKEHTLQSSPSLTKREHAVARLAAQGLSNKEIGKRLFVSENTIKTQLKSVFEKLGITSRVLLKQKLEL